MQNFSSCLVGLLNSKLLDYLTKKVSTHFSGGLFAYNKQYIQSLPIIIPVNQLQMNLRDQITDLAKKVMGLYQNMATSSDSLRKELLMREATVYEERIDELVYDLYGLNDEEKRIVDTLVNPA